MKKIILILLIFFFLATISVWIYIELALNEKGIIKEMKVSNILTDVTTLNSKRFIDLLDGIEQSLPKDGAEAGIYDVAKLQFPPDANFRVVAVSRDKGVAVDGSIQKRTMVALKKKPFDAGMEGDVQVVLYHYPETDLTEITVNGIPAKGDNRYRVIIQWNSATHFTEISHKYESNLFRPNVVKRIAAGLGICALFFFLLMEKKKDGCGEQRK